MTSPDELRPSPRDGAKPGRPWQRTRERAWRILGAAVGLAVVAGLVLPVVWGGAHPDGTAPTAVASATPASSATRVDIVRPVRGGVRRLTIQPGTVHAFESVELYAKASGFLQAQAVDIGSTIRRGDVLAEIDAPELREDVEEASAALERARAQADQAASRVETAEAERAAAAASAAQAEADIARLAALRSLAEKVLERIRRLHSERNASEGQLEEQQHQTDATRASERVGLANAQTAKAQAKAADAKVRQAQADVAEARAAVRVAESRLDRAKVLAGYTRLVAPFDGVVTRRTFHPGAFIRSAAEGEPEPLLKVIRTDKMRVVIQVPDLDVPLLDVGDKVTVVVDALKGRELTGTVARLGKSEDPTTRTMRVEVDLPNPDGLLVEGMYGRATIELQPPTSNLTVPAACVVGHSGGKAAVFVVRGGKARRTAVTLGNDDGSSVEILSGIGPDDEVVLRPGPTLDDGAAVVASSA